MSEETIIYIMSLKRSNELIPQYKQIYKIATGGQDWTACLCGTGSNRLYSTCLNYSKRLIKESETK